MAGLDIKKCLQCTGLLGLKTRTTILLLITILLILSSGCKKTPTGPGEGNPPLGSRDYIWIIDTIKIPMGYGMFLSRMWGTSAQDVWAVGPAYVNEDCIWHYDGISWKATPADKYVNPEAIFGFGKNDIWIGSTDGGIWHFDGTFLTKKSQIAIDSCGPFHFQGISGKSPNDIYAVGFANNLNGLDYKGIIMHYDGTKWNPVTIPYTRASFSQIFYNSESDEYLINGWMFEQSDHYVFTLNNNEFKTIIHNNVDCSLNKIGSNIYSASEYKLFKYQNAKFNLFKDFTGTDYAGRAWGRNEKDFFTINWGGIGHYNGSDLITIVPKANNDWAPNESIIFEKDFFSIWQDTRTAYTISIHGILKN